MRRRSIISVKPDFLDIRLVHVGRCNSPGLVSLVHKRHHLFVAPDHQFRQILHVWSQARMLTDPQVARILGIQEISDFLVVNLTPYD